MTTLLDDEWIGLPELGKITGDKIGTLHNKISRGDDLPIYYKFKHRIRFRKSDVEAWLKKGRRIPAAVQLQQRDNNSATDLTTVQRA